jgi:uncharacterized membrane protein SirB2
MLVQHYAELRLLHVACAVLSGALFGGRRIAQLRGSPIAKAPALRRLSYLIDSTLLASALLLMTVLHQTPFNAAWLAMKVALVAIYIVLGSWVLRGARTQRGRIVGFAGAMLVYATIIGVAVTHRATGWLALLLAS